MYSYIINLFALTFYNFLSMFLPRHFVFQLSNPYNIYNPHNYNNYNYLQSKLLNQLQLLSQAFSNFKSKALETRL